MQLNEARELIYQAVTNGEWVERSTDYSCVTVSGVDYSEATVFDALEQLRREGEIVMLPRSTSSRGYREVDRFKCNGFVGAISEFVAAGVPRSKAIIDAQLH